MVKQYKESELLQLLPSDWSDITVEKYFQMSIVDITEFDDVDNMFITSENNIKMASIFFDMDVDIIKQFPIQTIRKINDKLSFLTAKPKPLKKTKYKWITKIEEPDYDTFIWYIKMNERLDAQAKQLSEGTLPHSEYHETLLEIVQKICLSNLDREQVLQMPMDEFETGFFLLRVSLIKYLNNAMIPLQKKIVVEKMKKKMKCLTHLWRSSGLEDKK